MADRAYLTGIYPDDPPTISEQNCSQLDDTANRLGAETGVKAQRDLLKVNDRRQTLGCFTYVPPDGG